MNYGVQKCIWTALGDITANIIQATLVIFVLGNFFSNNPNFLNNLKWIGVFYLLYLAYDIYNKLKKTKSVISVSKSNNSLKRNFYIKNKYLELVGKKNKTHKNIYQVNGNFYIGNKNFLDKYKSFYYTKKTIPIILKSGSLSIDIDTKEDFDKARRAIKKWAQN